jgi:hypothetical protein
MTKFYYLTLKSTGGTGVVASLNGVPLVKDLKGGGINTDEPVNKWLMPQKNALNVLLAWPPTKPFAVGESHIEAMIFVCGPAAITPKPETIFASVKWPIEGKLESYPHAFNVEFVVPDPPPARLWEDAKSVSELTDGDKAEILSLVERLRAALLEKDAEKVFSMMSYRYGDEAKAEGKGFSRMREVILEQYRWLFERGELKSDLLGRDMAAFKLMAQDKIVWISKGGVSPAVTLEQTDGKRIFAFEVFVSKIDGKWTIVR